MSRRFKGTSIPLDAPERLLPTESTGLDLREARSMNRPTRDFGYDRQRLDDGPRRRFGDNEAPRRRFGDDEVAHRSLHDDDGPSFRDEDGPRRSFRDDDGRRRSFRDEEGPRRAFSRRADETGSAPAAESDDDWRSGPARTTTAPRRFESSEDRRLPRREEKEDTAADLEDDWRAGSASRSSAFASKDRPRRDEGENGAPVRRLQSRRVEESRADDVDWRKKPETFEEDSTAPKRFDRIRSTRATAAVVSKIDDDDDWRTVKPSTSASSFGRRTERSVDTTPHKAPREAEEPRRAATPTTVEPKREEAKRAAVAKEDTLNMDKVAKFAAKLGEYVHASSSESMEKKVESLVKKIPVNFGKAELSTLELMRAVLALVLSNDLLTSETDIERLISLIAPVVICLEEQYVEFGGKASEYGINVLEEVQKFVASLGCPRLNSDTALVERIWVSLYESQTVCEEVFQIYIEDESMESPAKSTTVFQTEAFSAWLYDLELTGVEATKKAAPVPERDEWSSSDESDIEALVPKRFAPASVHVRPGAVAPLRR